MIFKSKKENLPESHRHWVENLGFSLEVPENWDISDNQFFALFIAAPAEDRYRANIGFNAGTLEPATEEKMAELFEEAYQQQKQTQVNYKLISSEKLQIDGQPALLRQTERHEPNNGLDLTQLQSLILGPQAVYNVSATSLTSHAEKYIPLLKTILQSIKFGEGE